MNKETITLKKTVEDFYDGLKSLIIDDVQNFMNFIYNKEMDQNKARDLISNVRKIWYNYRSKFLESLDDNYVKKYFISFTGSVDIPEMIYKQYRNNQSLSVLAVIDNVLFDLKNKV